MGPRPWLAGIGGPAGPYRKGLAASLAARRRIPADGTQPVAGGGGRTALELQGFAHYLGRRRNAESPPLWSGTTADTGRQAKA